MLTWTKIGVQSFGGGASTSFLIQSEFIDKHKWISLEEYAHYWSLCVFTPGINLIALTVLIGRKLGGTSGIITSLIGLLLPSATVTCLLSAGFQVIQGNPIVQAVLRGVIPATAGILLLVGLNFARPLIGQVYKEGIRRLAVSLCLIVACTIAIALFRISVIPVLLGCALLSMLLFTEWRVPAAPKPVTSSNETLETFKGRQEESEERHD